MARRQDSFPLKISEGNVSVSIYRQDRTAKGKGFAYIVADRSSGSRRLQSFANLDTAKTEATRLARLLATGQTHAATFSNEDAANFGQAVSLLTDSGAGITLACSVFAEAVRIVGNPNAILDACRVYAETHAGVTKRLVSEAVADYIETKAAQKASPRYLKDLHHRLGKFAEAFVVDVDDVTTPVLSQWLDGLKLAPQTMRNFRTVLSGFFTFAKARGWSVANPAEGLTVPRMRGGAEPEVFTPEEFGKLLAVASEDFLPCLVLGGFCGLRTAEIERIHWEDVNLAGGEVVVRRGVAKTRSRRIVPLGQAGKAWLASYVGRKGAVWPWTPVNLYKVQQTTATAAGVPWKANGLRHGYASHRLAETGDAVRVAHEMGNSPDVVHAHYKALVNAQHATEWFSIMPLKPGNLLAMPKAPTENPKASTA
jgi:integrase